MKPEHDITIHIDQKQYKAESTPLSGLQVRALVTPPIGQDRDLWLTVPGPADDKLIGDTEEVDLTNGMHFYTAPRSINPGAV